MKNTEAQKSHKVHQSLVIITSSSMENNLHERTFRKNTFQKAVDLLIFILLLSLLVYRLRFLNNHGFAWFLAFLCESWFTFTWILTMNAKWDLVEFKTHPERLPSRVDELPPVDLFVTTADPVLEPPIITVNTVLSLLALDYPANKLACYVSDDGASPVTYYALVEALAFSKHWVPFCKQYNVLVRAPFRYFSAKENGACGGEDSSEFQQDWIYVKNKYEELCRKIEVATQSSDLFDFTGEYAVFSKIDRRNHPSIVKVIWENKENLTDGLPHLIYISREKRLKHPHHFKAGAMNVLTRVSGVMTNAPYMLNVDCDMFVNDPKIALHAMCFFLEGGKECAFVQCPQNFYGALRDDPFGTEVIVMYESIGCGIAGIQGILYGGTGCFHRREVIYGLSPDESGIKTDTSLVTYGKPEEETLKMRFGSSIYFVTSAAQILSGKHEKNEIDSKDISTSLKAAIQVSDSTYEYNTHWGSKIGWVYGSTTEDILTGLSIQAKGWQSVFFKPDPPAFLGCAPTGGPACMTQQKRWATGLLEVLFGENSPVLATINQNLWFRQCLAYLYITSWGLRSIPELCYSLLPAYCILINTYFMPKFSDRAMLIPTSIFIIYNLQTILEYRRCGFSIRSWWNYNRMKRISTISAWTFGVISVIAKLIGVSDTVFEVTRKETSDENDNEKDPGRFTFDDSPLFVLGTVLVLAHITSLSLFLLGIMKSQSPTKSEPGLIEFICSAWVLLSFLPFVKGLYRKGKYGIPTTTICKAMALVGFFVHFCTMTSNS